LTPVETVNCEEKFWAARPGRENEMNVSWLIPLMVAAIVLLLALVLIGLSARRAGHNLKKNREGSILATEEIRGAVLALRTELDEMKQSATDGELATTVFVPAVALTADQRAGALEMLRNGADTLAVSGALRLPHAETALLQKVQRLMDSTSSPK
jgi:hypothetical protein